MFHALKSAMLLKIIYATCFMIGRKKGRKYNSNRLIGKYLQTLIFVLHMLCSQQIFAQYENIWMFGQSAGVDFNDAEPKAIRSYFDTLAYPRTIFGEASASVCNAKGELLFYTEGSMVINRKHELMRNGDSLIPYLRTGYTYSSTSSASQGTIIVPIPSQSNKYYVFSLTAVEAKHEGKPVKGYLFYSMVDMSADAGLGAVVAGQKGILLDTGLTEHMTAVAADDYRVWLLTISKVSEHIKSFEITGCGINHTPVLSAFPDYLDTTVSKVGTGCIAISPDRTKIAIASNSFSTFSRPSQRDGLVLLDFDTLTGHASNLKRLSASNPYGACFSPDNTKLYVSFQDQSVNQFDLSAGSLEDVKRSEIRVLEGNFGFGHLKSGPDNRVYFWDARWTPYKSYYSLGVINNPDRPGIDCEPQREAIKQLDGTTSHLGLPNVIVPRRIVLGMVLQTNDSGCAPFTVAFDKIDTGRIEYFAWNFGDGSALSYQANPQHTYLRAGVYTASLYVRYKNRPCMDTSSVTIVVFPERQSPDISARDTLLCTAMEMLDLSVVIRNPTTDTRIQWGAPGGILEGADSVTVSINPNLNQLYYVWVADTIPGICGLSATDTIRVDLKPRILDIVNDDTLVCQETRIALFVSGSPGYTYQWYPTEGVSQPNGLHPIITASQPTTYTITASYTGCPDTAQSIYIDVEQLAGISFSMQADSICQGESITFYPEVVGNKPALWEQHWQYGDGNEALLPGEAIVRHAYQHPGTFPVTLTGRFRVCPDTTFMHFVYVQPLPFVDLGGDTSLCLNGAPVVLQNIQPSPLGHYRSLWSTGDTSEMLTVLHSGRYSLTLSSAPLYCSSTESVAVVKECYLDMPNTFSPNGDGINDYFFPRQLLSGNIIAFSLQIFNRWGQQVFETQNTEGRGWDGYFKGMPQPQGVYIYRIAVQIEGKDTTFHEGNVTLIR